MISAACSKVEDSLNKKSMDRAERRQRRLDQKNWGGGVNRGKKTDANRGLDQESVDQRASKCAECGSEEKKLTRAGPLGSRTLCNACGLRWAAKQKKARNAAKNLQDTSSEGESVEDIVQERGADMYIKDLERKLLESKNEQQKLQNALHVSDANVSTFRKLNEQRQHKIDELQTLVESLTAKISEISASNGGSSSAEAECVRLRSELRCLDEKLRTDVRILEEKNRQLLENMQHMSELLSKNFATSKEILDKSIQLNGDQKSRSWRSGVVTDQQQQTGHYQESKKASNAVKTRYEEGVPDAFDGNVDLDADIGDNEPDYYLRKSERLRTNRNLHEDPGHVGTLNEDPIHVSNGVRGSGSDTAGRTKDHEWERGCHGAPVDLGNGASRDRRSEEVRGSRKEVEGRTDKPVAAGGQRFHGGFSGEEKSSRSLIPSDVICLVRPYVDQSFITWVNSKLRKPTPEEMIYHKSQFSTSGKNIYWSGIPGSEILAQYEDACPMHEIPNAEDLQKVFRVILNIQACPMRPNDVLWCLVWQDCVKIEQLPGYYDMDIARVKREMRRPRSPGVDGAEDTDRSFRQRYTYQ